MEPLVSILIPAYNAEKWIRETIVSALGQTWPRCEVILVDDGSSDNTFDVANRFQSKTLKVVRQENKGASAARNKALALAQGDYIQWLDADDLLAPDKIEEQLKYGDGGRNSLRLLSSTFGFFYYNRHKAKFITTKLWQDLKPVEWFIINFTDRVWIHPAAWLVSRRLTNQIGPWNEKLSLNDDGEYFGRAVATSVEVKYVSDAKSYYRKANSKSLSSMITHNACESLFLTIKLCIEYLLVLENSERTRDAALKHLQNCLIYFYPEERQLLDKIYELAKELGGCLTPPELKFKYIIIRKIFGWDVAKKLVFEVPRLKKNVFGNYDRLIHYLAN